MAHGRCELREGDGATAVGSRDQRRTGPQTPAWPVPTSGGKRADPGQAGLAPLGPTSRKKAAFLCTESLACVAWISG